MSRGELASKTAASSLSVLVSQAPSSIFLSDVEATVSFVVLMMQYAGNSSFPGALHVKGFSTIPMARSSNVLYKPTRWDALDGDEISEGAFGHSVQSMKLGTLVPAPWRGGLVYKKELRWTYLMTSRR